MKNVFTSFIAPALDYVDKGSFFRQPFYWLYAIIAVLCLLVPVALLVTMIQAFKYTSRFGDIVLLILSWIVMCGVSWLIFQLWWNRKEKVRHVSGQNDDFVAIPVFSHFIQTAGESAGIFVGAGMALLSLLGGPLLGQLGIFPAVGVVGIVLCPIAGFLIVVVSRAFAESLRALASIANNTKK